MIHFLDALILVRAWIWLNIDIGCEYDSFLAEIFTHVFFSCFLTFRLFPLFWLKPCKSLQSILFLFLSSMKNKNYFSSLMNLKQAVWNNLSTRLKNKFGLHMLLFLCVLSRDTNLLIFPWNPNSTPISFFFENS